MKRLINGLMIKSNWFDDEGKYNKIGIHGLILYFTMAKYAYMQLENGNFMLHTSITLLRKETKLDGNTVLELLKLLVKHEIIKLNISRWDQLLDDKGKIIEHRHFTVETIDCPNVTIEDEFGKDNYYLLISLNLVDEYLNSDMPIESLAAYCLINRYTNNEEGKCWLTIEKMSEILGLSRVKMTKIIKLMNKNKFLCSRKNDNTREMENKNGNTYNMTWINYEHKLLTNLKNRDKWLELHEDQIQKNLIGWNME